MWKTGKWKDWNAAPLCHGEYHVSCESENTTMCFLANDISLMNWLLVICLMPFDNQLKSWIHLWILVFFLQYYEMSYGLNIEMHKQVRLVTFYFTKHSRGNKERKYWCIKWKMCSYVDQTVKLFIKLSWNIYIKGTFQDVRSRCLAYLIFSFLIHWSAVDWDYSKI